MLEKEILGVIDGKCNYAEQMPNGGKMECMFSDSDHLIIAQYYKDLANAESVKVSANIDLETGEQISTTTINGKASNNPLYEALTSGVCVVSGY